MTLTKEQIHGLNRINAAAQKAGLGDILAKIEKVAIAGDEGPELDLIREELDGMLEMIVGLEEKINTNTKTIEAINVSLTDFATQLKDFMKIQKKLKPDITP